MTFCTPHAVIRSLDYLKKGSSELATAVRHATRWLEAHLGGAGGGNGQRQRLVVSPPEAAAAVTVKKGQSGRRRAAAQTTAAGNDDRFGTDTDETDGEDGQAEPSSPWLKTSLRICLFYLSASGADNTTPTQVLVSSPPTPAAGRPDTDAYRTVTTDGSGQAEAAGERATGERLSEALVRAGWGEGVFWIAPEGEGSAGGGGGSRMRETADTTAALGWENESTTKTPVPVLLQRRPAETQPGEPTSSAVGSAGRPDPPPSSSAPAKKRPTVKPSRAPSGATLRGAKAEVGQPEGGGGGGSKLVLLQRPTHPPATSTGAKPAPLPTTAPKGARTADRPQIAKTSDASSASRAAGRKTSVRPTASQEPTAPPRIQILRKPPAPASSLLAAAAVIEPAKSVPTTLLRRPAAAVAAARPVVVPPKPTPDRRLEAAAVTRPLDQPRPNATRPKKQQQPAGTAVGGPGRGSGKTSSAASPAPTTVQILKRPAS